MGSRHTGFDLATPLSVMASLIAGADNIFAHTGTRFVAYPPWVTSPFLLEPPGTGDNKVALLPIIGFAAGLIIHLPFWRMHEARELGAEATNAAEAEQAQPGHSRKGAHGPTQLLEQRRRLGHDPFPLDHERRRRPAVRAEQPVQGVVGLLPEAKTADDGRDAEVVLPAHLPDDERREPVEGGLAGERPPQAREDQLAAVEVVARCALRRADGICRGCRADAWRASFSPNRHNPSGNNSHLYQ